MDSKASNLLLLVMYWFEIMKLQLWVSFEKARGELQQIAAIANTVNTRNTFGCHISGLREQPLGYIKTFRLQSSKDAVDLERYSNSSTD